MAKKNIPIGLNPPEQDLEKRVDKMMVVDNANQPVPPTDLKSVTVEPDTIQAPVLDIYSVSTSAPEIPGELLDAQVKPLSVPVTVTPVVAPDSLKSDVAPTELPTVPKRTAIPVVAHVEQTNDPAESFVSPRESVRPVSAVSGITVGEAIDQSPDIIVPPLRIDDAATDAAVDAIVAKEGDDLLAAQDELQLAPRTQSGQPLNADAKKQGKSLFKKAWFYIVLLLLLVIAVSAVPVARYKVAGLVYKTDVRVTVLDSKTNTPVSNAKLTVAGHTVQTDANGRVVVKVAVGQQIVYVTKQYYADQNLKSFVGFKNNKPLSIALAATGRQVPITVRNILNGKPVAGAEISVSGTSAKTDKNGTATIVLPTKTKSIGGKIAAAGLNTSTVTIEITSAAVASNTFKLTPAGKIYFLSNEAGTLDVVKTNLDGTSRQTVLKGTGKEDVNTTVLLAAHDWQYAVLKAQRDSSQAALYLIDTSNDKLVEFDSGDANFTPIGWTGHNFIYDAVRNNVATTQNGHELLKSYDAERGQLNQLDDTKVDGSGTSYAYQGFYNFSILGNLVLYNMQWFSAGGADIAAKTDSIRGVQSNGQNKKDYQTIPAAGLGYIQAAVASPSNVYYSVFNYADSKTTFYEFEDTAVKATTSVNQSSFNKIYPSFVPSPSGKRTLWSERRDGKNVVLVGDGNAANPQTLTTLAGYTAYGWYSEDYILVVKGDNQIYISSSNGSGTPLKVADYFKPPQSLTPTGYGGL